MIELNIKIVHRFVHMSAGVFVDEVRLDNDRNWHVTPHTVQVALMFLRHCAKQKGLNFHQQVVESHLANRYGVLFKL